MAFLLVLSASQLTACTSKEVAARASQKTGSPRLSEAESLKGLSFANVEKELGHPSDSQGSRKFWLLSTDSTYHPSPESRLYEFIFVNDRLVKIQAR